MQRSWTPTPIRSPVGDIGELIFHGPGVMKGYWQAPEETKKVLTEIDGTIWLKTGDLEKMDQDGYFWFYDRKRDRIKYKGYRMRPVRSRKSLRHILKSRMSGLLACRTRRWANKSRPSWSPKARRGGNCQEDIVKWCKDRRPRTKFQNSSNSGGTPKTVISEKSHGRETQEKEGNFGILL